jgi:Flp pilus assembly protein TadG
MLADLLRRFSRGRGGNVAITFALALVPAIFLIGMGLDFSGAIQKRSKLNAAADAAALAAVTPTMMTQSLAASTTAATNMFNAVASAATGVTSVTPTINVTASGLTRTAVVSYTASSTNNFPGILGQTSWPISGTSTATATTPPNIDFYLMLDNSPSMAIAATTAGINKMIANTKLQDNGNGCAFACHETNPTSGDNAGNPGGVDNYTLAKNLGVVTRIQNMATATQALMSSAQSTESSSNATYRMAIYTFNTSGSTTCTGCGFNTVQTLTQSLSTAAQQASTIDVLVVCSNNKITCSNSNSDTDTDFNSAMSQINTIMPNPGTGASTSTPQEVLFLVSDGVDDRNSSTCSQPLSGGTRCQQPFETSLCTKIKNRGILIAVLYTVYYPLPANAWYTQWISPFQSQIATNMQSCASPGLYFAVSTDGDITSAMQALFQQAVATARLSN